MDIKYSVITRYIRHEPARIPRPANAFMIYANHNRKKMAQMYPLDSNKEISKRLGNSWKELDSVQKLHYYDLAKQVDTEHKRKYPDYVYNPKEARIRKAMREASRERTLGVAQLTSPRAVRRPATAAPAAWNFTNEDQLMMAPASHGIRGGGNGGLIGSPMCAGGGTTGYPIQSGGNGSFTMQSMHYNKHMHPITHSTGSYMQANSIGPLVPQSELWQPYEDSIKSTPGPYILPPQMPYPQTQSASSTSSSIAPPHHLDKTKIEPEDFTYVDDSQSSHTNENIPPNGDGEKMPMNDPVFENKLDSIQPLMDNGNMHNPEPFMPSFADNVMSQTNGYDKNETIKLKKEAMCDSTNPFTKLQCPKNESDYHREYIKKYLMGNNCQGIEILINEGGNSHAFNYVTYNSPQARNYDFGGSVDFNDVLFIENCRPVRSEFENESGILNLSTSTTI